MYCFSFKYGMISLQNFTDHSSCQLLVGHLMMMMIWSIAGHREKKCGVLFFREQSFVASRLVV